MKTILNGILLLLFVGAGIFIFERYKNSSVAVQAAPQSATPAPALVSPSAPVAAATPAPQPPEPAKRYAPEGVYFLVQRVSISNENGIVGIPAGRQVKILKQTKTGMHVTDGTTQFDVTPNQLTNDLDIEDSLVAWDKKSQEALTAEGKRIADEQRKTYENSLAAHTRWEQQNAAAAAARAASSKPMFTPQSTLDKGAYNRQSNDDIKGYNAFPYGNPYGSRTPPQ